jgi:cytochrome oxidase Cu insertion factor (SCO1/SenC/PrrC family)
VIHASIASVQTEISAANKAGKVVFLVVTEPGNSDNAAAVNLAKAAQKLHPKSAVIELNRADNTNSALVKKYGLSGAPLPVLLVIASNGVVAGGSSYKQTTAEKLVAAIPSPKKAEVLKAMTDGNSVFLVVSKKSMKTKDVISSCSLACNDMKNKAKTIEVDFDDAKEKKFLSELSIASIGDSPQTYVINAQGQLAGTFTGATDSKTLVATATKRASSGCCPAGSGKSCGPKK